MRRSEEYYPVRRDREGRQPVAPHPGQCRIGLRTLCTLQNMVRWSKVVVVVPLTGRHFRRLLMLRSAQSAARMGGA